MSSLSSNGTLLPEELADRLVPAQAAISPDGRYVACVVACGSQKETGKRSAIWCSKNGELATVFTSGTEMDTEPAWSPDSQSLAFLSDRAEQGKQQLYVIRAAGGEAQPLGHLAGALSQVKWSPDGESIALLRRDEMPPAEVKQQLEGFDQVVVDASPRYNRLWIVSGAGEARQLTFGDHEIRSWDWSTDGQTIFAIRTVETGFDAVERNAAIVALPVSGGLARPIATSPVCPHYLTVAGTPDGDVIAVSGHQGRVEPAATIWTVPATGGELRNCLPGCLCSVQRIFKISGANSEVGAIIARGLHSAASIVNICTGEIQLSTTAAFQENGATHSAACAAPGHRFALIWADGDQPEELYLAKQDEAPVRLTDFGKQFANRLQLVEEVFWLSDGIEIQGLLTLPAGYEPGRSFPLVLEVHGGPSSNWSDSCFLNWHDWAQMLASNGIAVLAPNPRGSTGRGSDFERLLQDDVGGGESRDLIAGAAAMVARGLADPARLGIAGWSWGGYLTAYTITQTTMFRAAFMGAGLSNMISDHGQSDIPAANLRYFPGLPYGHWEQYWQSSPLRHINNIQTPLLIAHGDSDARVQPAQSVEMHQALKALGVPVEFVRYPHEKHSFVERSHQIDLMERITAWFRRWLLDEPAP